jgi:hypothetical protein
MALCLGAAFTSSGGEELSTTEFLFYHVFGTALLN